MQQVPVIDQGHISTPNQYLDSRLSRHLDRLEQSPRKLTKSRPEAAGRKNETGGSCCLKDSAESLELGIHQN